MIMIMQTLLSNSKFMVFVASLMQEEKDEKRVLVEALRTILTPGLCLPDIQRLDRVIAVHFPGDATISDF